MIYVGDSRERLVYKTAARMLIRRNIRLLNQGRYAPALSMFAPTGTLAFPGRNSWSSQHREPKLGRDAFATHRGRAEIEAFLQRFVDQKIWMEVEDILVNGPPWNMRAAARVHHWIVEDGEEIYANRAVLMVRVRWGRIIEQEDYEDTERVAAYDERLARRAAVGPARE
jgi:ketosteroid isomerase-like protein